MKVLIDRDHTPDRAPEKAFYGTRIIPGRSGFPYLFIRLEVKAVAKRIENLFRSEVWHPSTGWHEILTYKEEDFPFALEDASLEGIYQHMVEDIDQLFSGEAWESEPPPEEEELPPPPKVYRNL